MLMALCHIEDTILVCTKDSIELFKTQLKKRFKLKELGLMTRHLGIWYDWRMNKNCEPYVVATVTSLINEIIKVTEEHLKKPVTEMETPVLAGGVLERTEDGPIFYEKMYRTIIGKIMY